MVPTWLILSATVVLLVLWLALAAWVVGARARPRPAQPGPPARRRARSPTAADPERWSRRRLWRTADGDWLRRRRRGGPRARLARRAAAAPDGHRNSQRRSHALRVLTRGGSPFAFRLLRSALETEHCGGTRGDRRDRRRAADARRRRPAPPDPRRRHAPSLAHRDRAHPARAATRSRS